MALIYLNPDHIYYNLRRTKHVYKVVETTPF